MDQTGENSKTGNIYWTGNGDGYTVNIDHEFKNGRTDRKIRGRIKWQEGIKACIADRQRIEEMVLTKGMNEKKIADEVGVHIATIYRELRAGERHSCG